MTANKAAFNALFFFSKNKTKKSTGIPLSAGMVWLPLVLSTVTLVLLNVHHRRRIGNGGLLTMSTTMLFWALSLIIWL